MLKEIVPTRQIAGEPRRVWFMDDEMDLIVWFGEKSEIIGFQLCDDKGRDEHALTWRRAQGYSFERVDDGEGHAGHPKMTPILVQDGIPDIDRLSLRFGHRAQGVPKYLRNFVIAKLRAFHADRGDKEGSASTT
jgi:hypothetical protein